MNTISWKDIRNLGSGENCPIYFWLEGQGGAYELMGVDAISGDRRGSESEVVDAKGIDFVAFKYGPGVRAGDRPYGAEAALAT
jgi:hypothetical protein